MKLKKGTLYYYRSFYADVLGVCGIYHIKAGYIS